MIYGHIPAPTIYDQNDEIDTLRAQLAASEARAERYRAALREVEPYLDAIICYASTQGEHHPNKIAADIRAALAEGEGKP